MVGSRVKGILKLTVKQVKDILLEAMRTAKYGVHGVIVAAVTKAAYELALQMLRVRGLMVCVGLPMDHTVATGLPPSIMCMKSLQIVGSIVGTK